MFFRDDYDRYGRDYYPRDRYDDRPPPPLARGGYSLLDDPPLHFRDLSPPPKLRMKDPLRDFEGTGGYLQGSVYIIPGRSKAPTREKPTKCNTVFVGSLPESISERHLYDTFKEFGPIQDVRVARSRGFGHVEFKNESSVDKAILFNGYSIRIGPDREDVAEIHVDYAQSREASDAKRRMKSGEMLAFNAPNAQTVSSDLRNEDTFEFAAKNLVMWFEKGNCSSATANTFFGLLSSINSHCHKLTKDIKSKEEDCQAQIARYKEGLEDLYRYCDIIDDVFEKASQKKSWDQFTKPQRKTIGQWKDVAQELKKDLASKIDEPVSMSPTKGNESPDGEPPTKKMKAGLDTEMASRLARNVREIEQLKLDHEVAIEKKEKQILQLKTVLARFKQNCPDEWEKIINGKDKDQTDNGVSKGSEKINVKQESTALIDQDEGEGEWEVIDGVNMDDLNKALDNGSLVGGGSLAQAAAAYAQLRTQLGSTKEETGSGLNETDIALTAVMAAFLTVHPLGATLGEIQTYFMTLNSTYNSYYLESLLRRLPKVFQHAPASADGEYRWWFLGFQTVSVNQYLQQNSTESNQQQQQTSANETEMTEA